MKKLLAYALVLVMLLALVGCNTPKNTPNETTPQNTTVEITTDATTPEATTPEETTVPEEHPENPLKEIASIVDLSEKQGILTNDAIECFYTDANFQYFFDSIKSEYVMVYYTDGTSENVTAALGAGNITIADLKKYDIWYFHRVREDLPNLTVTVLRELIATHGENLTWEHFDGYFFIEMGSGLYIRNYLINEEYTLLIGGGNPPSKPDYIYFYSANMQDGEKPIDVRYESIDGLLNPADIALIVTDYENTIKDELNALREKYPHRTYYYHPVSKVHCVYFLQGNTTAEEIVRKYDMENVFSNTTVSAFDKTKTIIMTFDRDDFTEAIHQKLKEIRDDESAITSLMVDMSRDIVEHFVPRIDYYSDHAVPLEYVATNGTTLLSKEEDVIMKTKAEYDAYLDNLLKDAKYDYQIEGIAELRELYDEAFFEENALIITGVITLWSGSDGKRVDNLYVSDNTVYVMIETTIPEWGTDDIRKICFTIHVPKSEVASVDTVISVS